MALASGEQLSGGKVVDVDLRQVVAVEGPGGGTVPISGNITATSALATANTLAAGSATPQAGASAQLVAANSSRKGLQVVVDTAAASTSPVYLLLGAGTASATAFHIALGAGGSWDGLVGDVTWTGAVQFFGTGSKVGVVEV